MGIPQANLPKIFARVDKKGADARLTLREAVALIASTVKGDEEELILVKKRIRMQLLRSHKKGDDVTSGGLACGSDRRYTIDELARWARQRYPGKFNHLPTKGGREVSEKFEETLRFESTGDQEVVPGNLQDCQVELVRTRGLLKKALRDLREAELDYQRRLNRLRNLPGNGGE